MKKKFADDTSDVAFNEAQSACLKIKIKTIASGYKSRVFHNHGFFGVGPFIIWIDAQLGRFNTYAAKGILALRLGYPDTLEQFDLIVLIRQLVTLGHLPLGRADFPRSKFLVLNLNRWANDSRELFIRKLLQLGSANFVAQLTGLGKYLPRNTRCGAGGL